MVRARQSRSRRIHRAGGQILGGSETSEDDFWLYDFEVPALARMATGTSQPFAITHARISEAGFDGSEEDLLSRYRESYAAAPDGFLVQLFDAAGIGFDTGPELTQFEEWLLLLDMIVPPNGSEPPRLPVPDRATYPDQEPLR